jgi:photosystem II stability/assembly factor-like uncharacterized protein
MKNIHLLILALMFILINIATSTAQDQWETVYSDDISMYPLEIREIKTSNNNITALGISLLMNSSDNGNTWQKLYPGTNAWLTGICYTNDSTIWVCGKDGTLIKYDLKQKKFYDHCLYWDNYLYSISFFDDLNGLTGGKEGKLFRTTNGGTDWDTVLSMDQYYVNKIILINKHQGYVLFYHGYHQDEKKCSKIYQTNDGGNTWSKFVEMPDELVNDIYINGDDIWLVGNYGLMTKSTDGGKTWQWYNMKFVDHIWSMLIIKDQIYITSASNNNSVLKSNVEQISWKTELEPENRSSFHLTVNKDYIFTVSKKNKCIVRRRIE